MCGRPADPGQFQSAIVNMAVNARDAMPQGGKLVIETRNIELDAHHADYQSECSRDITSSYQCRIRERHGAGNPRSRVRTLLHHQGNGRGTGLGLAMVYGFVKQSGGHVTIYSEPGLGPRSTSIFPAPTLPSAQGQRERRRGPSSGRETVLVVEDDSRVRQLTIKRLKLIGYGVLEASDGPARSRSSGAATPSTWCLQT